MLRSWRHAGGNSGFALVQYPRFARPHFQLMASLSGLMCISERGEQTATLFWLISVGSHLELRIAITFYYFLPT